MTEPEHPFWRVIAGEIPPPPTAALLGWRVVEAVRGSGRIRVELRAREDFTNPMGNIQGGFLAAMLDDTLGPALATTLAADEFAPTLELKVSFLRPARPGPLIGEGRVVHRGGTIAFLEGSLATLDGQVVATASATARIVRMQATTPPP